MRNFQTQVQFPRPWFNSRQKSTSVPSSELKRGSAIFGEFLNSGTQTEVQSMWFFGYWRNGTYRKVGNAFDLRWFGFKNRFAKTLLLEHGLLEPSPNWGRSLPWPHPYDIQWKIASKVIANRLKPWLDKIISPVQSIFALERLITNNVLLVFEINHFLNIHSKGRKHFMNLKLDISKAYDKMEWSFLRRVLESLSSLFQAVAERETVHGVAICRGAPRISNMLIADNTMVFCPANFSIVHLFRMFLIPINAPLSKRLTSINPRLLLVKILLLRLSRI
ncbi:UNVERIFIED_CONTAM: hypothetical protein Scaly_2254400 [Sesamum calycinum]|uniref:Reverse transcriptase domain-containing protein n=1 Tax=Sesamum calycinum TaxID=2727403 RepID=A0AAW2MB68_9LAMI